MNKLILSTQDDISTIQIKLPLDIGIKIDPADPVVTFKEVFEGVNLSKYVSKKYLKTRGRNGYDPIDLLKIVLFAYMINVRSTRKIEALCRNDIRFMYLSNDIQPTFMTIDNFINSVLTDNIEAISSDIVQYVVNKYNIDVSTIFIDGTKLEAFSNKYTWVWKKACITSRNRQFKKISELLNELNKTLMLDTEYHFEIKEEYEIETLKKYLLYLQNYAKENGIVFSYEKRSRKKDLQKKYDLLKTITDKLEEYAIKINKCGEGRNSYSKTDPDATFMRMKTDYMGNTALLPAYNWQLASAGELILYGLTSQSASDNKCFIPLMEKHKQIFGEYPKKAVGDAGYGNLENYNYCQEKNIGKYLKFSTWKKETHDKKFHEDPFRSVNFKIDDNGNPICPNGKKFIKLDEQCLKGNVDKRTTERYICEDCTNCPFREKCHDSKGNRVININKQLTAYHEEVIENLASEEGINLRMTRSYMSEGAFGVIKQDYNYKRITRVTKKKVNLELYLVIIGFNLVKAHNFKFKNDDLVC